MMLKLNKGTLIFEGVILTILGILAICLPVATSLSITILIGILCVVTGVVQMIRVFQHRGHETGWLSLISAILAIIVGVLLLVYPIHGVMVLTLLLGIWFLVHGVIEIAMSVQVRHFSKNWGLLLLSGVVSIILSIIIWSGWPVTTLWVMGLLLGINLIFFGIGLFALAFRLKSA